MLCRGSKQPGVTGLRVDMCVCLWRSALQVCNPSSLAKAIKVVEDNRCVDSVPMILAALDRCQGLEGHTRDSLRLRLNMAAGQLGEAARDALELARREQVRSSSKTSVHHAVGRQSGSPLACRRWCQ